MTTRGAILRACVWSALPSLAILALAGGLMAAGLNTQGQALLIGALIALPLALGGALLIARFAQAALPLALFAALAAFGIRILGAGIVLVFIPTLAHAGLAVMALVGGLVAALGMEMYGLARSTPQEPVRA